MHRVAVTHSPSPLPMSVVDAQWLAPAVLKRLRGDDGAGADVCSESENVEPLSAAGADAVNVRPLGSEGRFLGKRVRAVDPPLTPAPADDPVVLPVLPPTMRSNDVEFWRGFRFPAGTVSASSGAAAGSTPLLQHSGLLSHQRSSASAASGAASVSKSADVLSWKAGASRGAADARSCAVSAAANGRRLQRRRPCAPRRRRV